MAWVVVVYFLAFAIEAALMGFMMFQVSSLCMYTRSGILHCISCKTSYIKLLYECGARLDLLLQLIKLADLENDFINPHDASSSLNNVVVRGGIGHMCCLSCCACCACCACLACSEVVETSDVHVMVLA